MQLASTTLTFKRNINMYNKTSQLDSGEQDQGFMPNRPTVQNLNKHPKDHQPPDSQARKERPSDYQPRFICGAGLIKKQPPEVYQSFPCVPTIQQPKPQKANRPRQKFDMPAQQLYFRSKYYRLLYNRYTQKQQDTDNFTSILINLDSAVDYDQSAYTLLRPFQPHLPLSHPHNDLIFDSKFQSGNLAYAFKRTNLQNQYDLFLQNDTNTFGYCQWFYFSLKNMKKDLQYRFNIVNQRKKQSLFAGGMMKPAVFSLRREQEGAGGGWQRCGRNVTYSRSRFLGSDGQKTRFYTLSFSLAFPYENDYVMVAMNLPYSYSRMMGFLKGQVERVGGINEARRGKNKVRFEVRTVGYSLSNISVPMVTVTEDQQEEEGRAQKGENKKKKMIVISARQHPGETWSSYLMQGLLQKLLDPTSPQSTYLRKTFLFVLFPMVNVDGVVYGNFRTDLGGVDLNRQWNQPSHYLHPQIFQIRKHLSELSLQHQTEIYLDLHGHSKKMNTFCYSCKEDPYSCRVLPLILAKFEPSFHLPDCTFGIDKYKQNTARAFMYYTSLKVNMLTLQISFFGTTKYQPTPIHYEPRHMSSYAQNILKSLFVYLSPNQLQGISRETIEGEVKQRMKQFSEYDQNNVDDSGSESDPYAEEISVEEKVGKVFTKRALVILENDKVEGLRAPVKVVGGAQKRRKEGAVGGSNMAVSVRSPGKLVRREKSMTVHNQNASLVAGRTHKNIGEGGEYNTTQTLQIMKSNPNASPPSKKTIPRFQRSYQIQPPAPYQPPKRQSIDLQPLAYIVQPSTQMPLQSQYQRSRLAQLARSRYFADSEMKKSSSSQSSGVHEITRKRHKRQVTKMPRVAILNDSIEQTMEKNHPVLCVLSDKKKQQFFGRRDERFERLSQEWSGNNLFPIRRREKIGNSVITYEKFRQRSEKEKQNLHHITKCWRENVDKYSRELQPPF